MNNAQALPEPSTAVPPHARHPADLPPAALPLQPPKIAVANSQSASVQVVDGVVVNPVPTLDGLGLMIVSLLLGAAVFWIWRRQQ